MTGRYDPSSGPFARHMIAGSIAGFVSTRECTYRLGERHQVSRHDERQIKGWSGGSFRNMYRGVGAVFAGCVPAHAMYYSIYEKSKEVFGANRRGHRPLAAGASNPGTVATTLSWLHQAL